MKISRNKNRNNEKEAITITKLLMITETRFKDITRTQKNSCAKNNKSFE